MLRSAMTAAIVAVPMLWAASAQAQDAAADGERLFRTRCASCHSVEPGQNRIGPSLAGVFGREAGKVAGARYSDGLKASGIVWGDETLDRYLDNPRQVVPGSTMVFAMRDAIQRAAIIAYLRDRPKP